MRLAHIVNQLVPEKSTVTHKEMLLAAGSAFVGLALLTYSSSVFISSPGLPILVASMGAAAVLLFAAPSSPMSKPWAFLGGHLLSSLVGVTCYKFVPDTAIAIALAVSVAMLLMYYFRCIHPPGGATALAAIIGGPSIHDLGYLYTVLPVGLNITILLGLSLIINGIFNRHPAISLRPKDSQPKSRFQSILTPFSRTDLTAALHDLDTYIDVSQQDLNEIFSLAMLHSKMRDKEHLKCEELMNTDVISFEFGSELEDAWLALQKHKLESAPVVDNGNHVIGQVSITDYVRSANRFGELPLSQQITKLIKRTPGFHSDKPEVVGQIMSKSFVSVKLTDEIKTLFKLFSSAQFKQVLVLDEANKLKGVINKSDLANSINSP